MKSCTLVTTIGMMVQGFDTQVTSAIMPDLHDLRFDLPKAGLQAALTGTFRDQHAGGRISGLTMSPTRRKNCSTRPFTPARTTVLSRSTWA